MRTSTTGDYTENSLVEQPAIALFEQLGWEAANCFYESFKDSPSPVSSPGIPSGFALTCVLSQRERSQLRAGDAV
jgi:hypothetical protein